MPTSYDKKILAAIQKNDLQTLLKAADNPNYRDNDYGLPLLHIVVKDGSRAMVDALVRDRPALVKATHQDGYTALHIAAKEGKTDLVLAWRKQFPWLHPYPHDPGYTALYVAAESGQTETALALAEDPALRTAVTKAGYTALHIAAYHGKMETLLALAKAHPELLAVPNPYGCTVLHMVAKQENIEMFQTLAQLNPSLVHQKNAKEDELLGKTPIDYLLRGHHIPGEKNTYKSRSKPNPSEMTQLLMPVSVGAFDKDTKKRIRRAYGKNFIWGIMKARAKVIASAIDAMFAEYINNKDLINIVLDYLHLPVETSLPKEPTSHIPASRAAVPAEGEEKEGWAQYINRKKPVSMPRRVVIALHEVIDKYEPATRDTLKKVVADAHDGSLPENWDTYITEDHTRETLKRLGYSKHADSVIAKLNAPEQARGGR
jgi:hypothetical protein